MHGIGERLLKAIEITGKSPAELARVSGVAPPRIHEIATGKTQNPQVKTVTKLARGLGIDASWLMTGEGEMNSGHRERPDGAAIHGEFLNVPLYGHASGALPTGHWAINGGGEVQEYLAFERAFARSSFGTTANLVCLRATGDSMLPTISQGDLLVIDMSDCTVQKDAAPYILQIGETTAVKRLHRLTKNTIRIASDNPAGWSKEMTIQEMEAEGIEIKGRVVAIMKMA